MSVYQEKSNQNLTAANLLLRNSLYPPSVHCSYYSCIQLMFHILFIKLKLNEASFKADVRNHKTGSHVWASKLIESEIYKIDRNEYKWFQKSFPEIKKLRENADYSPFPMKQGDGHDAIRRAESINNLMTRLFK